MRSAPSASTSRNVPATVVPSCREAVTADPIPYAAFRQSSSTEESVRVMHASIHTGIRSMRRESTMPRVGGGEVYMSRLAPRTEAGKSCTVTLMPIPSATSDGPFPAVRDSQRMPEIFRSSQMTSFGHLRSGLADDSVRTVSRTASPVANGNAGRASAGTRIPMETSSALPRGADQLRPMRPRPTDWWSAATMTPSGAPDARCWKTRSCVLGTSSSSRMRAWGNRAQYALTDSCRGREEWAVSGMYIHIAEVQSNHPVSAEKETQSCR